MKSHDAIVRILLLSVVILGIVGLPLFLGFVRILQLSPYVTPFVGMAALLLAVTSLFHLLKIESTKDAYLQAIRQEKIQPIADELDRMFTEAKLSRPVDV